MTPPAQPDVRALRDLATEIAVEAGDLLASRMHDARTDVSTKSSRTDMVTEMDAASEELVVRRIVEARPDDSILGEEGAARSGTSGIRWVVDPLDGTTNYLYRLPGWNVSIGVEIDDEPVAGAVVVPGFGDVFAAAAGHGATRNGEIIRVSGTTDLSRALVGTGFSYDPATRRRQAESLTALLPSVRDIRRFGAAAADLCAVACGRLDAYAETGLSPWDRAAGMVIAREAGALVEERTDATWAETCTVASTPALWDPLLDALRDAGTLATS